MALLLAGGPVDPAGPGRRQRGGLVDSSGRKLAIATRHRLLPGAALALFGFLSTAASLSAEEAPYHDFRTEVVSPGPSEPAPLPAREPAEIRIGWFGSAESDHPLHGDLWVAAELAVEEANAAPGPSFRLLPRWSENPWGSGIAEIARTTYEDGVVALIAGVDGPSAHLAEQVAAKALLPVLSPVGTDPSVQLAGVPWIFSLAPSDAAWAPLLVSRLLETTGPEPFALLATTEHDSRVALKTILDALSRVDRGPVRQIDLQADGPLEPALENLLEASPAAVVVIAGPIAGARFVRALRRLGYRGTLFGPPAFARRAFLDAAGESALGLVVPELTTAPADRSRRDQLLRRFQARTGHPADWAVLQSYDATRLLIEAIRRSGTDRQRLREAILALSPWEGTSGRVEWDPTGRNLRPLHRLRVIARARTPSSP